MHEISSTIFVAPPKDDAFKVGTQMERRFSASPRSSGFWKSCSGKGASLTRGAANNQQRSSLKPSIHSKGKEKLRKSSNVEDKVGFKGFEGFINRGSSVMVFPYSLVTREKGLNSVGTCGMMVVENIEVSSSPHSQSSLSIPPLWLRTSTSESFCSRSSQFNNSVSVSYEFSSCF